MAEEQGYVLSESDLRTIRELLKRVKESSANTRNRPELSSGLSQAPEVYIALTPSGGIPGVSPLGTGTESAECTIYNILEDPAGSTDLIQVAGFTRTVHNISEADIPEDIFIIVYREKWGSWIADYQASSVPLGASWTNSQVNSTSHQVTYHDFLPDAVPIYYVRSVIYAFSVISGGTSIVTGVEHGSSSQGYPFVFLLDSASSLVLTQQDTRSVASNRLNLGLNQTTHTYSCTCSTVSAVVTAPGGHAIVKGMVVYGSNIPDGAIVQSVSGNSINIVKTPTSNGSFSLTFVPAVTLTPLQAGLFLWYPGIGWSVLTDAVQTLPVGTTLNTFGNSTNVAQVTINEYGFVTLAANVAIDYKVAAKGSLLTFSTVVTTLAAPAVNGRVLMTATAAATGLKYGNLGWMNEIPAGTVNGSNSTFTLSQTPIPANTLPNSNTGAVMIFIDGLLQPNENSGADAYGVNGTSIVFNTAPATGKKIRAVYQTFV